MSNTCHTFIDTGLKGFPLTEVTFKNGVLKTQVFKKLNPVGFIGYGFT